jgi:hypothetical protein
MVMNKPIKEATEPILKMLHSYCAQFAEHPLFLAARDNQIPLPLLHEFAFYQYSDSILWIPMLALMKSKAVRSPRLRRAIEENMCCEAGLGTTAHVQLAGNLLRSLGIFSVEAFPTGIYAESASLWLSSDFAEFTEPETAGWLLVAETLVPIMFAKMKVCFDRLDGCDTTYFAEHITVDTDEHSAWMAEAVEEVVDLYGPAGVADIMAGMEDARRETLEVPDQLYEKLCASRSPTT